MRWTSCIWCIKSKPTLRLDQTDAWKVSRQFCFCRKTWSFSLNMKSVFLYCLLFTIRTLRPLWKIEHLIIKRFYFQQCFKCHLQQRHEKASYGVKGRSCIDQDQPLYFSTMADLHVALVYNVCYSSVATIVMFMGRWCSWQDAG